MKKTYYYTYKVQCTAVGWEDCYYLGQHKTNNLDDGYKGSGVGIQEYYKQYPDDYVLIILGFYNNKTELNIAEQKLIGDLWKSDPYCLNRMPGGNSSPSFQGHKHSEYTKLCISTKNKAHIHTEEHNKKISEALKGKPSLNKGIPMSEEQKRKISQANKGKNNPMYGKHQSEETKRKMSESRKGKNNPMYGKPAPTLGRHRVYREDGTYYLSY